MYKRGSNLMSQEIVLRTLAILGFFNTDIKVYIYLAKKGTQTGKELSNSLKMQRQRLYPCLRRLQKKGVVNATCQNPVLFSALPFEKVLDLFIEVKREQAKTLQESKKELLSTWRSIIEKDYEKS
jgi:sugar-specific transcriptional regulator TrmB